MCRITVVSDWRQAPAGIQLIDITAVPGRTGYTMTAVAATTTTSND